MPSADSTTRSPTSGDGSHLDARRVMDVMADLLLVIGDDATITGLNASVEQVLGWRRDEWIGRSVLEVVHPDDVAEVLSSIGSLGGKSRGTPIEVRARAADGAWHLLEIIGTNALDDPDVRGLVCVARDVTQRRMWEIAGNEPSRLQRIVQVSPSMTLLLDADGHVVSVNGAFTRLLGHDPTEVVGGTLSAFAVPGEANMVEHAIAALREGAHTATVEVRMQVAGDVDHSRPIRFEMVDLVSDPLVGGIVVTGSDVSDLHLAREELEHLARHDSLTGLANRTVLVERLERWLRAGTDVAVLFVDLDRFKPVNDLYGHEIGDELLRLAARRLERVVRPTDLVARVGGDEFVVVAADVSSRSIATWMAERLEAALAEPYPLEVGPVRIGASVGVALSDGATGVADLLADADVAMYDAKSDRRGMATRSMAERRRTAVERRKLADELAVGIDRGEVVAHLQPIVDVADGRPIAVEALARWNHPQLGVLPPGAFMGLVDDAGLDLALGDAVFESACAAVATLPGDPRLSVNLSVGQLTDPHLVARLCAIAARYGITPDRLVVEITEQAMLARRSTVGAGSVDDTVDAFHAAGVGLALDDFGTGYSSLTHVRRFPLAELKVDRSFVAGIVDDVQDRAVVEVVIGLGRALGLTVVAEGVERVEQAAVLRDLGCHLAQGYLYAAPMPAAEAASWFAAAPRPVS